MNTEPNAPQRLFPSVTAAGVPIQHQQQQQPQQALAGPSVYAGPAAAVAAAQQQQFGALQGYPPAKPRRGRPPKHLIDAQFFGQCAAQSTQPGFGSGNITMPIAMVKTNLNAFRRDSAASAAAADARGKRKYTRRKRARRGSDDDDDEDDLSDDDDNSDDMVQRESYSLRERRRPSNFRYGEYNDGDGSAEDDETAAAAVPPATGTRRRGRPRKSTSTTTSGGSSSTKVVTGKPRKRGRPRTVPKHWDAERINALDRELDGELDEDDEAEREAQRRARRKREHVALNTLTPAQMARLRAEREAVRAEQRLRRALRAQEAQMRRESRAHARRRHHSYRPRCHHARQHHAHVGENEDDSSYSSSYSSSSYTSSSCSSYTSEDDDDDEEDNGNDEEEEYEEEEEEEEEVPQNEMVERILIHRIVWRSADPRAAHEERQREEEQRKAAVRAGGVARSPSPVVLKTEKATNEQTAASSTVTGTTAGTAASTVATPMTLKIHISKDETHAGQCRVVEYFVKFKETSYLHARWVTEAEIVEKEHHVGTGKVKRYWRLLDVAGGEQEALQRSLSSTFMLMGVDDVLRNTGYAATSTASEALSDSATPEEAADFFYSEFTQVDRIIASGVGAPSIAPRADENTEEDDDQQQQQKQQQEEGRRMYLVKWLGFPYTDATWEYAEDFRDDGKIEEYQRFHVLPARPPPPPLPQRLWVRLDKSPDYKNGNALRPYQLEGVNWLIFNWCQGRSCILADEMGLGKTVQIVAFFEHLRAVQLLPGPFLVIVPLSTMPHWEHELREWTDMNVVVMTGPKANREQIKRWEWYYLDADGRPASRQIKFNVLLTTPEMVNSNMELDALSKIRWQVVIIDEAHRLKNVNCKLLQCLELVRGYHRILLTGTPIQNNTQELWSLLHFIEPETFADLAHFMELYGDVKDPKQVEDLKEILRKYLLKRVKADVEKSIPPKEETIVDVELTSMQKQYYRAFIEHNRDFLTKGSTGSGGGSSSSSSACPHLVNLLMELRKVCCHPFLIRGVEERETPPEAWTDPQAYLQVLVRASGKFVLLDKLLPKLHQDGHKVLIFSQLKGVLDLVGKYLKIRGYLFERLDGSVKANERVSAISRFGNPEFNRFAFLLSTRAGGVGVNLTSADTVIIFDSDWNPQNDVQAQARCHRIGQKKEVKVYRLISKDTYEESMFERASRKLGLEQAVLSNMNTAAAGGAGGAGGAGTGKQRGGRGGESGIGLSKDEIAQMLKHGVYALYKDEEASAKASATFCEEDIGQILERRSKRMVWCNDMQGSTFSKATFRLDGDAGADVDVNAPDFWEKVMPAAATSKSLFDQLTGIVTSKDASAKDAWRRDRKLEFLTSLQGLVADLVKSYNEAKGIQPLERDTLKSVLLLCISNSAELFTPPEVADLQKWLDDVDYSRRRRQASTSLSPSLATGGAGGAGGASDATSAAGTADAFSTPSVIGGAGAQKRKSAANSSSSSKTAAALRRLRSGDDDDYIDIDEAIGDGDDDDDDDDDNEGGRSRNSRRRQSESSGGGSSKGKRRGRDESGTAWKATEQRLLQEALFAVCRGDWALVRRRARLERPLCEVRAACLALVDYLATRTTTPDETAAFARLRAVLEDADAAAAAAADDDGRDGRSDEEIAAAVELGEKHKTELAALARQRMPGWARRIEAMLGAKDEVEDAARSGREVLAGCALRGVRWPCAWWEPAPHNRDLLLGLYRHGWGLWDTIILDEQLSFRETIRLHYPAEFAAATSGAAGGSGDHKGLPMGGTRFQSAIAWPQNRTLQTLVSTLVRAAERHRKGEDVRAPGDGGDTSEGDDDVVLPPSQAGDAEAAVSSATTAEPPAAADDDSNNSKKDKKKSKKKDKKTKHSRKSKHRRHSRSRRSKDSSSSSSSSSETDSDDEPEPPQQQQQPALPKLQLKIKL